jgi:hypothetical protein
MGDRYWSRLCTQCPHTFLAMDYTALQVEHAVLNAKFVDLQKKHAQLVEQNKTRENMSQLVFDALLVCATSSFMWNLSSQIELYNASIDTFVNRIVKVNPPIHPSPSEEGWLLLMLFAFVLAMRQVFKTRPSYVAWWVFCVHGSYVYVKAALVVLQLMDVLQLQFLMFLGVWLYSFFSFRKQ